MSSQANGPNAPAVTSALPAMPDAEGNFKGIRVPKLPASMRKRRAVLNPDKDMSAAHAFDGSRLLPRALIDPDCEVIPFGEHEDDDKFLIEETYGPGWPE